MCKTHEPSIRTLIHYLASGTLWVVPRSSNEKEAAHESHDAMMMAMQEMQHSRQPFEYVLKEIHTPRIQSGQDFP